MSLGSLQESYLCLSVITKDGRGCVKFQGTLRLLKFSNGLIFHFVKGIFPDIGNVTDDTNVQSFGSGLRKHS